MVVIIFFHIGIVLLFLLYLVIKPDNQYDRLFQIKRHRNELEMLRIVNELEQINQTTYPEFKKEVIHYFSDQRITNQEDIRLEDRLLDAFFLGFQRRMIPFKRADFLLKLLYLGTFILNLAYFNYLVYTMNFLDECSLSKVVLILAAVNILLFLIPLLFSLFQLGLISMILSIFTAIFPAKGSIFKAQLTLDELIKLLKPGGRNTPTDLRNFSGSFIKTNRWT